MMVRLQRDQRIEGKGIGWYNMIIQGAFSKEKGCESIMLDVYVNSKYAINNNKKGSGFHYNNKMDENGKKQR